MKVRIYTDGACSGNPGAGGWAAIAYFADGSEELSGGEANTTNNRMELMPAVKSLENIIEKYDEGEISSKDKIEIHSDSAYLVNSINEKWVNKWRLNGWKTVKGKDVKNRDLWEKLISLIKELKSLQVSVKFVKVKGHNGNVFNETVDGMARSEAEKIKRLEGDCV